MAVRSVSEVMGKVIAVIECITCDLLLSHSAQA